MVIIVLEQILGENISRRGVLEALCAEQASRLRK
jgi:hypothetical protein